MFQRSGRASYLNAETWAARLQVDELKPERMSVQEFPGYNQICIAKATLDIIVRQQLATWKGALSNVGGIYLITPNSHAIRIYEEI